MMSFCSEAQHDILQVALKLLKYFVAVKPNLHILIFVIYIIVYCIFKHRDYISHNSQIVCICLHT